MFSPEQKALLSAKLDPAHVASRKQSGRSLSYIEGWHAIAEANRIFGFDAWNRETVDIRCVAERPRPIGEAKRDGWGVSYVARVRVTVGGIVREGVGSGHGIDVDLGLAHESAIKEAETDAMKRALMTFGNPFGLALYDKSRENVGVDEPTPKAISVAEQKRQLSAIDEDLTDCHTIADVDKCAKVWGAIIKRDEWSKDYRDIAAAKFPARRAAIQQADEIPASKSAERNPYLDAMRAG